MTGQSVARATGHDTKGSPGVHQRPCHLIDSTVATYGHNHIDPLGGTVFCNLCSVTGIFRQDYFVVKNLMVDGIVDQLWELFLRMST